MTRVWDGQPGTTGDPLDRFYVVDSSSPAYGVRVLSRDRIRWQP